METGAGAGGGGGEVRGGGEVQGAGGGIGGGGGEVRGGGGALAPVEAGGASPIPTLRKFPRAAVASDGRRKAYHVSLSTLIGLVCHFLRLTTM